jgi:hypothetical protein
VIVPALRVAPSWEARGAYRDHGDIHLRKRDGTWGIVEVKWLNTSFTCRADWPHRYVFIGSTNSARRDALMHVMVNKEGTHAARILLSSAPYWGEVVVYDRVYQQPDEKFECPIALVRFIELPVKVAA